MQPLRRLVVAAVCLLAAGTGLTAGPAQAAAENSDELDGRIARLIEQLGDKEYAVRRRAQQELARLGFSAFDALTEAEQNDDLEIATQARYLVRQIRIDWTRENAPTQVRQMLKDYDFQNDAMRLDRLKKLLELPGDSGLEWLCRLLRFEQSHVVSKQAALLVILQDPQPADEAWAKRAVAIEKNLDRSSRPAAAWLKTYVLMRRDPEQAVERLSRLVANEQRTLDEHPQQSDNRLVMQLMRYQVDQLQRLSRNDEALAAMAKMVDIERGDPQSLAELVDWLAKRQAWSVIEETAARFDANFEGDPQLLYTLAQARLAASKTDLAETTATKAFELNADRVREHYLMAILLESRGQSAWSDREYRRVVALAASAQDLAMAARLQFAESLHDRQLDADAADVLQGGLQAIEQSPQVRNLVKESLGREVGSIRSRMLFFRAGVAESQNDRKRQRELLDEGIAADPTDADVLIALYHLPDQDVERQKKTRELIQAAAVKFRGEINSSPDEANNYNQYAWLIGNTEGDFDEAIQMAQKSVDLARPRGRSESIGGHLDTLAHCYAAKGDFENAVKTQTEAARLMPHSHQLTRKLAVFRQRWEEKQAAEKK